MPLMLLGFVFAIGLFIFYLVSTSDRGSGRSKTPKQNDDIKKEENVIFLPTDIERAKRDHRKNK